MDRIPELTLTQATELAHELAEMEAQSDAWLASLQAQNYFYSDEYRQWEAQQMAYGLLMPISPLLCPPSYPETASWQTLDVSAPPPMSPSVLASPWPQEPQQPQQTKGVVMASPQKSPTPQPAANVPPQVAQLPAAQSSDVTPIARKTVGTSKSGARIRRQFLREPLEQTKYGCLLLGLTKRRWHKMANGLSAMRFGFNESHTRAHDAAAAINWLKCGAYCHQSTTHGIIAIVNLDCLNERLAQEGHPPITAHKPAPKWTFEPHSAGPSFLRPGFVSPRLRRP